MKDKSQHTVETNLSSNGEFSFHRAIEIDIIAPSSLSNSRTSTKNDGMEWSLNHGDRVNSIARSKAVQDFKDHLRLYSASTSPLDDSSNDDRSTSTFLDQSGFSQLLQDIGYKQVEKTQELFRGLLEEINDARMNQHDVINPSNGTKGKQSSDSRKQDCIYPDDLELLYNHSLAYVYKPKLSESFVTAVDNAFPAHDGDINASSKNFGLGGDSPDNHRADEWSRQFSFTAGEIGHIITAEADADKSSKTSSISIRAMKRKKCYFFRP